jgi:hypothetical protein
MRVKGSWAKHRSLGEYSSKKWKSFLKHHKDNDVIKCNAKGLAVVEPGNPAETFRCKNVSSFDQLIHHSSTNISRLTTTTSRATRISAPSLEKGLHLGAGSHPMVGSSSPLDRQMVLHLPRSTRTASLPTWVAFPNSPSSPSGGRFVLSRTT